ncbi:MAG: hypothetical protein M3355_08760, partial [Actinomycetota bacterium]|nr:hypothetical protein [Actinomycetota bacterium]
MTRLALRLLGIFALAGVVAGLVLLVGDDEVSSPRVGEPKIASADSTSVGVRQKLREKLAQPNSTGCEAVAG